MVANELMHSQVCAYASNIFSAITSTQENIFIFYIILQNIFKWHLFVKIKLPWTS